MHAGGFWTYDGGPELWLNWFSSLKKGRLFSYQQGQGCVFTVSVQYTGHALSHTPTLASAGLPLAFIRIYLLNFKNVSWQYAELWRHTEPKGCLSITQQLEHALRGGDASRQLVLVFLTGSGGGVRFILFTVICGGVRYIWLIRDKDGMVHTANTRYESRPDNSHDRMFWLTDPFMEVCWNSILCICLGGVYIPKLFCHRFSFSSSALHKTED